MRYFFLILIIILIACESPFDVPSDKGDKIVIKDPYLNNPVLKIIPDSIDFGFVFPNEMISKEIQVINISDETYTIDSCEFYNDLFVCNNSDISITPNSISNDSASLEISFSQSNSGIFVDSMIIDRMYRPVLLTTAKVPFVYSRDTDFGAFSTNELIGKIIKIENNNTDSITVTALELENNALFKFSQNPELPFKIPPKSSKEFLIRFVSNQIGEFNDRLRIGIDENLIIKEYAYLKAKVE